MNVRGLFLLLLSMSILFSSPLSEYMSEETETSSSNLLVEILYDYAIPIALIISYLIVALAFMVSKIFNSRETESWAKLELREVLISTMYAALIIGFFPVFNSFTDEFSVQTTTMETEEMFIEMLDTSFVPIMDTIKYLFTFSSLNWVGWSPTGVIPIPFTKSVVRMTYSHYYDGKTFTNLFSLFAHTFIPILFSAMVSIMGQIVILNFLEKVIFVFIGLGLAMRSFSFTRKMGGTLLAVVLGTFFLFKLLLVLESSIYINLAPAAVDMDSDLMFIDVISTAITFLMEGFMQLFEVINFPIYIFKFVVQCMQYVPLIYVCLIYASIMWIIDLIIALVKIVVGIIFWAISLVIVNIMGVVTLTDIADKIIVTSIASYSDVIVFAFFMPILNFMIIIAGIKSLTETFGGDTTVVNMLTFI